MAYLQEKFPALHYGWVIAGTGMLVIFSCFGLARYAYAMLLPGMQDGLGLTYDQMGLIGTGNFAGYLIAVLAAPVLIRRFRPRKLIACGLALIGFSMLAISCSRTFGLIILLYTLVGIGGGCANIPLMTMVTCWFRSELRGKAAGIVICGNGAGIMFGGALIPLLNHRYGAEGWSQCWLVIGLVILAVAVCAGLLLRNNPAELGLEPLGRPLPPSAEQMVSRERKGDGALLVKLGMVYMAFGATFMVYGTFIVATMVKEYGFNQAQAGKYWSWVGLLSLFSGVGFGTLSDRIGRKRGLAVVFAVQAMAYLLAGLRIGPVGLLISIILYGLAVFAIPAIMTAAVGDYLGLSRAAASLATVTIFFAAGQTFGPAGAGFLAERVGSFAPGYLVSAAMTAAAALYSLTLPPPRRA